MSELKIVILDIDNLRFSELDSDDVTREKLKTIGNKIFPHDSSSLSLVNKNQESISLDDVYLVFREFMIPNKSWTYYLIFFIWASRNLPGAIELKKKFIEFNLSEDYVNLYGISYEQFYSDLPNSVLFGVNL